MNQTALIVSFAALCGASFAWAAGCGPSQVEPEVGKAVGPPQNITCPEGKVLQGGNCVAAAPKPACAEGQVEKDGKCEPAQTVKKDCPAGTHVGAGGDTCVADETAAQAKVDPPAPAGPCPAGMAFVKGGSFKTAFLRINVTVSDVCLDITEAMTKEYAECVDAKKCNTNLLEGCTETTTWKKPGKEEHPMVCIDFTQAEDYCKFRGKRLPTSDEWEWAGRNGEEGRLYSWGNDAPKEQACWSGGGTQRTGTCPVKEHMGTATPHGLIGMSGNVFEWVTTKLDSKVDAREGRGGSWRDGLANLLQVGRPGSFKVTYRCGFLGVRCAAEPKK